MSALLALWSAPRCRSTAFLRMMYERGDFTVVHEPFSHVADFGAAEVGDVTVHTELEAMTALRRLSSHSPVFFKDTTDFPYARLVTDRSFLCAVTHAFMIRDPRAAIASHFRVAPDVDRDAIGFARLYQLFTAVGRTCRTEPIVIDADDLVAEPHAIVAEYCRRVGIRHIEHSLTWQPRQLRAWRRAPRWHTEVSKSTGIRAVPATDDSLVDTIPRLRTWLQYHQPFYEKMRDVRINVTRSPR